MDALSNIANVLQILTSLVFVRPLWQWGKRARQDRKKLFPVVLVVALLSTTAVSALALADRAGYLPHRNLIVVQNRHYDNETVVVDDHAFYNCTFENAHLKYGGGEYKFFSATFKDHVFILLDSEAATNTYQLMALLGLAHVSPDGHVQMVPANPPPPEK
jgi:hypothetical protein